jgi:hypothetical protein
VKLLSIDNKAHFLPGCLPLQCGMGAAYQVPSTSVEIEVSFRTHGLDQIDGSFECVFRLITRVDGKATIFRANAKNNLFIDVISSFLAVSKEEFNSAGGFFTEDATTTGFSRSVNGALRRRPSNASQTAQILVFSYKSLVLATSAP